MTDIVNLIFKADYSEVDKADAAVKKVGASVKDTTATTPLLEKALGRLSSVGGPVGDLAGKFDTLKNSIGGATQGTGLLVRGIGAIVGAGATLGALLGASLGIAAVSYAPVIDEISDMADKYGITATEALVLDKALKDSGSSADEYFSVLSRVQRALSESGDESSKQSEAFRQLGVTFTATTQVSTVMTQAAEAYRAKQQAGTLTAQDAAAAQAIFGKNVAAGLVVVTAAATAEQELAELRKQGIGVTVEGTKAAGDLETAQRGFHTVMTALGSALVGEIVPSFTAFITAMTNSYTSGGLLKTAMDFLRIAFQVVLVPVRVLIDAFIGLDTIVQIAAATMIATWEAIDTRSTEPFAKLKVKIDDIVARQAKLIEQNKYLQTGGTVAAPSEVKGPTVGTPKPGKPTAVKDEITPLIERANSLLERQSEAKAKILGQDVESIKLASDFDGLIKKALEAGDRQKANLIITIKQQALGIAGQVRGIQLDEEKQKLLDEANGLLADMTSKNRELLGIEDDRSKIGEHYDKLIKEATDLKNDELVKTLQLQKAEALSLETKNKAIIASQKQLDLLAQQAARQREQQQMVYRWSKQVDATDFTSLVAKPTRSNDQQAEDTWASARAGIVSESGAKSDALIEQANSLRGRGKPEDIQEANRLEAEAIALLKEAEKAVGALTKKQNEAKEASTDAWAGMTAGLEGYLNSLPTLNNAMASFTQNTLGDFADRLTNLFVTGKFGFEDFVKTAVAQLIKLQMQMAMMKTLQYFGMATGGVIAKANGGAYNKGVEFFASGGVFNSPTLFNHANGLGMLGEAGPEAIMPLRRGPDGKLGVAAAGGSGGAVQINNTVNVTVQGGKTNEQTGSAVAEAVIAKIADQRIYTATRSGGILARAYA